MSKNMLNIEEKEGDLSLEFYIRGDIVPIYKNKLYYFKLSTSALPLLKNCPLQREINKEQVNKIYTSIEENYKINGNVPVFEPIHICKMEENYFILDGQHRCFAYKKFHDKVKAFQIPIFEHKVTTDDEFNDVFSKINSRHIIDEKALMNTKLIKVEQGLQKEWGNVVKQNNEKEDGSYKRCNRPYLDRRFFIEKARKSNFFIYNDSEIILEKMKLMNDLIRKTPFFRIKGAPKAEMFEKAEELNFYLGLDLELRWMNDLE